MAETKELDWHTRPIYERLQHARVEVQKQCTKKSGYNKFADFKYFELGDFLSQANIVFEKVCLAPMFNIIIDSTGMEVAVLDIIGIRESEGKEPVTEKITFQTPTAEANAGKNAIQNLGAKHTYCKRYLYMNALELAEYDAVDATIAKDGKEQSKEPAEILATVLQISKIQELYKTEEIQSMLSRMGKTELNKISALDASKMIKQRSGGVHNG